MDSLLKIYKIFDENYSSWGFDYLWAYLLNYPQDKIAIIDSIVMKHTKPVGTDYSRFPKLPSLESQEMLNKLAPDLIIEQKEYTILPLI